MPSIYPRPGSNLIRTKNIAVDHDRAQWALASLRPGRSTSVSGIMCRLTNHRSLFNSSPVGFKVCDVTAPKWLLGSTRSPGWREEYSISGEQGSEISAQVGWTNLTFDIVLTVENESMCILKYYSSCSALEYMFTMTERGNMLWSTLYGWPWHNGSLLLGPLLSYLGHRLPNSLWFIVEISMPIVSPKSTWIHVFTNVITIHPKSGLRHQPPFYLHYTFNYLYLFLASELPFHLRGPNSPLFTGLYHARLLFHVLLVRVFRLHLP